MVEKLESILKINDIELLIEIKPEYYNKYVAIEFPTSKNVISFNQDKTKTLGLARLKGYRTPIVVYIPDPNKLN